jgi:hypothetical protein
MKTFILCSFFVFLFANNTYGQQIILRNFDSSRMNKEQYPDSSYRAFTFDNVGNPLTMVVRDPCSTKPKPIVTASGPLTFCAGDSVFLSVSPGISILWSTGDTTLTIKVLASSNITVSRLDSFSYPSSPPDTIQCYLTSDTTIVTVNPLPPPISGPGSVCVGNTITLTDSIAGGTWSSSNTSIAIIGATAGIVAGVIADTITITTRY